jgi:hypothetical protein
VVEFLTDNTLGRIWYEMRQGDTCLKERCRYLVRRPNEIWLQPGEEPPAGVVADEALSQEELLRQAVHIPSRPLKDPREIRMLDPACGSMHFGLYAFDLYLAIYEEAWEIAQGSDEQAKQGEHFAAFVAYAAGFAEKADFLREVPRLVLQHNIHGVDIDPRATQIARLTLWLRAQRAWQEQGVEVAARPAISRSNVVCAEPMPGERELLRLKEVLFSSCWRQSLTRCSWQVKPVHCSRLRKRSVMRLSRHEGNGKSSISSRAISSVMTNWRHMAGWVLR